MDLGSDVRVKKKRKGTAAAKGGKVTVCCCYFSMLICSKWIMTEVGDAQGSGAEKPWLPERVKKALESAADFGDYRSKRDFTFLHVFSGKTDVLGEEICKVASEKGLVATVTFVDKEHDGSDLSVEEPYETILRDVSEGEFDGFHSGFPCNTFSVARWNEMQGMPGPIRSGAHIYGLPSNDRFQQMLIEAHCYQEGRQYWLTGS